MTAYAVLLRGINVGRRKVAMAELREVAVAAGFGGVRTLLNSGNLIVETDRDAATVRSILEPAIAERFGFEVPVVVRSAEQLRAAVAANPFEPADESQLIITFCASEPPADAAQQLQRLATDQETIAMRAAEVYIDYRGGLGRSRLAGSGDRPLDVVATGRNLRTVRRLVEMME